MQSPGTLLMPSGSTTLHWLQTKKETSTAGQSSANIVGLGRGLHIKSIRLQRR